MTLSAPTDMSAANRIRAKNSMHDNQTMPRVEACGSIITVGPMHVDVSSNYYYLRNKIKPGITVAKARYCQPQQAEQIHLKLLN